MNNRQRKKIQHRDSLIIQSRCFKEFGKKGNYRTKLLLRLTRKYILNERIKSQN